MKHTEKFILKIAEEFGYTLDEVRRQVNSFLCDNMSTYEVIHYLRHLEADDIRFIFYFNIL